MEELTYHVDFGPYYVHLSPLDSETEKISCGKIHN